MKPEPAPTYHQFKKLSKINRLQLLKALKRLRFNGCLMWTSPEGESWVMMLEFGDIVWAFDRFQYRRYRRYLKAYSASLEAALGPLSSPLEPTAAEPDALVEQALITYKQLFSWVDLGKLEPQLYREFLESSVREVLFDVVQTAELNHELRKQDMLPIAPALYTLDIDIAVNQVKELWQSWSNAALAEYRPELAPVIKQPNAMRAAVSSQAYQGLLLLLDGHHSLRDLAIKTRRSILQFTQALKPYLESGWLELVEAAEGRTNSARASSQEVSETASAPLIACIDDSLMICQSMGQVVKAAGYEFISITEASGAIKTLLMRRPSLIFLDLVMPNTNGYEICSQLRKTTLFKETPIIILSGNDGLVDQVRARLVGATDFLSKPMEPVIILNIIQKHLGQMAIV